MDLAGASAIQEPPHLFHAEGVRRYGHILRRIVSLLEDPSDRARFSMVNRCCYELVIGRPLMPPSTAGRRYAIPTALLRDDVTQVFDQTGYQIPWPSSDSILPVATAWSQIDESRYTLASGGFGVLCVARELGRDGRCYAIKVTCGSEEVEAEARIQQALRGIPNVLQLVDFCRATDLWGQSVLFQVTELAGLGSMSQLRKAIQECEDPEFQQHLLRLVFHGCLKGLQGMHRAGFCHLDVKPDNFVVTHKGEILTIDFGCSIQTSLWASGLYTLGDYRFFSWDRWMANNADPGEDRFDGPKADAFAAGLTLTLLALPISEWAPIREVEEIFTLPVDQLCTQMNYPSLSSRSEVLQRYAASLIDRHSQLQSPTRGSFWELIRGLITFEPDDRFSIQQALSHPWLAQIDDTPEETRAQILSLLRELVQRSKSPSSSPESTYSRRPTLATKQAPIALTPQALPLPHFSTYVQRDELEKEVVDKVTNNAAVVTCQGAPGMGKTQLATYIAHHSQIIERFGMRLWIRNADQPDQVKLQLLILARELNLAPPDSTFDEAFPPLCAFLRDYRETHRKPWLMVLDNADDFDALKPLMPPGGQLIITTREGDWPNPTRVPALTDSEAGRLTKKLLQREVDGAEALCRELGNVPLAIEQACAYMRKQRLSIEGYLHLLHSTSIPVHRDVKLFGKELPFSIQVQQRLTLELIEAHGALPLLNCLACLASEAIAPDLMETLLPNATHLQTLTDYAFVKTAQNGYSIHRLAQQMTLQCADDNSQQAALQQVMSALSRYHTSFWESVDSDEAATANERLVSHAVAALSLFRSISSPSQELKELAVKVLLWLPRAYRVTTRHQELEMITEELIDLAQSTWPNDCPEIAECFIEAAKNWRTMGRFEKARSSCERALAIYQESLPKNSSEIIHSLRQLGGCEAALGDHQKALAYEQQAYDLYRSGSSQENDREATHLNGLGITLVQLGDTAKGCELLEEAHRLCPNSPPIQLNLASALVDREDLDRAISLNREVLELLEPQLGSAHPTIAKAYAGIAVALAKQGNVAGAIEKHQRALDAVRKTFGGRHYLVADYLGNIGANYIDSHQWAQAEAVFSEVLGIKQSVYGKRHPKSAQTQLSLAKARAGKGEYRAAQWLADEAKCMLSDALGATHPQVADALVVLARIFQASDDLDRAVAHCSEALRIVTDHYGAVHQQVADTLSILAALQRAQGNLEGSATTSERCLEVLGRTCDDRHPDVAHELNNLACAYSTLEARAKSIPLFERAIQAFRSADGDLNLRISRALANLGRDYLNEKQFEKAAEALGEALKLYPWGREKLESFDEATCGELANLHNAIAMLPEERISDVNSGLGSKGHLVEASELYERRLELLRKNGAASSDLIDPLRRCIEILDELESYEQARDFYRELLPLLESRPQPNDAILAECLGDYGYCLALIGETREATALCKRAYRLALELPELGRDHEATELYRENFRALESKKQKAKRMFGKILRRRR